MSQNRRGGNNTQIYKLYKYDLNGNFIKEFDSLRDAMFLDKLQKPHLIAHLKGKYKHIKKYIYSKKLYMKYPKELLPKLNKVYQYDLDGNYISEFDNPHQIEEKYNVNNIYLHLDGKSKKCGNFIYSYEKKDKLIKWVNPNTILKTKKVIQYDLQGKFIKLYNSIKEASKELNISTTIITGICVKRKGYYQSNGFIFRHYNGHKRKLSKSDIILKSNKKVIIQYTLKGKKIKEFESISCAVKETGITTISDCLSGKSLHGGGFIWKYKKSK